MVHHRSSRVRAAALWLARDNHIDLALLDIDLGRGGNGVELARCLHQRHGIPSVFTSGSTTAARCGRDVALGLLSKPYSSNDLLLAVAWVDALLSGAKLARVPARMEVFARRAAGEQGAVRRASSDPRC